MVRRLLSFFLMNEITRKNHVFEMIVSRSEHFTSARMEANWKCSLIMSGSEDCFRFSTPPREVFLFRDFRLETTTGGYLGRAVLKEFQIF